MKLLDKLRSKSGSVSILSDAEIKRLSALPEPFKGTLLSMYSSQTHKGLDGKDYAVEPTTRITVSQGMALYDLCHTLRAERTLEIGLAYGFSAMYLLAANMLSSHTVIEPFADYWHGIGQQHIADVNCESRVSVLTDISVLSLPALFKAGSKYDLIYVDGNHRFDDVLIDFSYAARLCEQNGCVVLDDMWMPSVQRATSFIRANRGDFLEVPNEEKNISVFKKIAPDERQWNHFKEF